MRVKNIGGFYCINLAHRTDRLASFCAELDKTRALWSGQISENFCEGLMYQSYNDISLAHPKLHPYVKSQPLQTQLGIIGCYHAHLNVLRKIAEQNTEKWYVVFEDDIAISSVDWLNILDSMQLPVGYENQQIIFVDLNGLPLERDEIVDEWFRPSEPFPTYWGAHCYIVLGSAKAREALNAIHKYPLVIDVDRVMLTCCKTLGWYPGVVTLKKFSSDRLRHMPYGVGEGGNTMKAND